MIEFLPFPPSTNTYYRNVSIKGRPRTLISKKGREYRKVVQALLSGASVYAGDLAVVLDLHPPDRRKRDIDNYTKALLDAITHAGVWGDDSQVKALNIHMHEADKSREPGVLVRITTQRRLVDVGPDMS